MRPWCSPSNPLRGSFFHNPFINLASALYADLRAAAAGAAANLRTVGTGHVAARPANGVSACVSAFEARECAARKRRGVSLEQARRLRQHGQPGNIMTPLVDDELSGPRGEGYGSAFDAGTGLARKTPAILAANAFYSFLLLPCRHRQSGRGSDAGVSEADLAGFTLS